MKLTSETKLFLGIILATISIIAVAAFFLNREPAKIDRSQLITKDAYTKGNPQATVYLVEFSDFQCPACKAAKPVIDQVVEKNKDKLLFVYRHFPLPQHAFAQKAAETAEAAGAQGKFWPMYDLLFQNQEKFSDELFADLAKQLNLNLTEFNKALSDHTYQQKVLNDKTLGISLGINATPTFFLNGQKLETGKLSDLNQVIEDALKQ